MLISTKTKGHFVTHPSINTLCFPCSLSPQQIECSELRRRDNERMEEDNKMRISSSTSTTSDREAAAIVMDDDQILLISQLYPDLYTNHQLPKQDESKTRRKRRKRSKVSKEETSNDEVALMKKRKLSVEQVKLLELNFGSEHKLESERKDRIASELGLDPRQVAVWFQNRRARWKNKKLEEEYSKLKSAHDGVTVEKCNLETEVMKLKEQLCEANKEIQRLSVLHTYSDGKTSKSSTIGSPSSSSSSFSMVIDSHFPEDLVVDGFDQSLLYSPAEYNWVNLFGF